VQDKFDARVVDDLWVAAGGAAPNGVGDDHGRLAAVISFAARGWQNNTGKVTFQPCPSFVSGKLGDPDGGRPRFDLVCLYFAMDGT
jgi:hypothetical protein